MHNVQNAMVQQELTHHMNVKKDVILSGTGHRPNKLNNEYDLKGPLTKAISIKVYDIFNLISPDEVVTGMALGFDMILAVCSIRAGIKFTAAVPFKGQELSWPLASQRLYNSILENTLCTPIIISEGPYAAWKMQTRNEWMVNRANEIIACWDGTEGGTGNCVKYAQGVYKKIHRINPMELKW